MAEHHKEYECCALYRPDLEPEQLDAAVKTATDVITSHGGQVLRLDRWNKRYLAYAVKGYTEGHYVIYRWLGTKEVLPALDYQLRYGEQCLRHLVLDYTDVERKKRKRSGKAKAAQV
jgi:small subunit ribosomal protein S6